MIEASKNGLFFLWCFFDHIQGNQLQIFFGIRVVFHFFRIWLWLGLPCRINDPRLDCTGL